MQKIPFISMVISVLFILFDWSSGLKEAIKVENHDNLIGSHAYKEDSKICW